MLDHQGKEILVAVIVSEFHLLQVEKGFLEGMSADGLDALARSRSLPGQSRFFTEGDRQVILQKALLVQLVELFKTYHVPLLNPLPLFEEHRRKGDAIFQEYL